MKYFFLLLLAVFSAGISAAETPAPRKPTEAEQRFMDAIGAKIDDKGNVLLDQLVIDRKTRQISFPATVNVTTGTIEVVVSTKRGRMHESLFWTEVDPFRLQQALILTGYRNGPMVEGLEIPQGAKFDVMVKLPDGKVFKADEWLKDVSTGTHKSDDGYVFVGSNFSSKKCMASLDGNLININSGDANTILNAVLNASNINHEYAAVTEKIPEEAIKGEMKVTLFFTPFKATEKSGKNPPVLNPPPPSDAAILAELEKVQFLKTNILYDFQRLEPVNQYVIPASDRVKALKIIDMKLDKTTQFLKIYEREKSSEYYQKADKIRVRLLRIRELYQ